ncbi:MAG: caspase family protein, partial [Waterburya sp.]
MKRQLVYFLKLLAAVSLTAYLSSSGVLKAQNDSKAIEITDEDGKPAILYEESHALVIWAGNYQHWSRLNNVEAEARQVVNALEQRGFKVTTVGNPTGSELERAIKDFIANYGYEPDNRLVIFFSGHGHTRNQTKGYLVPVDAQDPTSRKNERDFLKVALPMQQIITWARLTEAKHVLFVFDSCFSGTLFKQRSSTTPTKYILDVVGKPVRQFLTAGDADEKVPAKSVFTPLFIRALNGEADTINQDGYVTGNELGNYLRQNLKEYDTQQTPQFGTIRDPELDQGD